MIVADLSFLWYDLVVIDNASKRFLLVVILSYGYCSVLSCKLTGCLRTYLWSLFSVRIVQCEKFSLPVTKPEPVAASFALFGRTIFQIETSRRYSCNEPSVIRETSNAPVVPCEEFGVGSILRLVKR
jgi:hypothetical protein